MKKILSLVLCLALMLTLGVSVIASGEAASEETAEEEEAAAVPDPVEPIEAGLQYFEGVTIGGESTGGAFYIYAPEHPHTYDMLSSFMNGLIFVYTDKPVTSMEEAQALVEEETSDLELAYALTVHKAQGSEFDKVILILGEPGRMLSREMLYTAITRQKDKLIILSLLQ